MIKSIQNFRIALGACAAALLTSCATIKNSEKPTLREVPLEQARKDSVYYRGIFNQTNLAGDTASVAEFNKAASKMKVLDASKRYDLGREILGNAIQCGITKDNENAITGVQYISSRDAIELKQRLADKYVYEQLFKRLGIYERLGK